MQQTVYAYKKMEKNCSFTIAQGVVAFPAKAGTVGI